jgi:hypothetical protein
MALSRPTLWTARARSGRALQHLLRCKAFTTDYRQAPAGIEGALAPWSSEEEHDDMPLTIWKYLMFSMGLQVCPANWTP